MGSAVSIDRKDAQRNVIPHAPIHRPHQENAKHVPIVPVTEDVSEVVPKVHGNVPESIQERAIPSRKRVLLSWDDRHSVIGKQSCSPGYVTVLPSDTDLTVTAFFLFASFVLVLTVCFELCYLFISVLSSRMVPLSRWLHSRTTWRCSAVKCLLLPILSP